MNLPTSVSKEKLPAWFVNGVLEPLEAGISSVFILHGDINCLVLNPDDRNESGNTYIKFREFWRLILKDTKIVIFYSLSSGIGFLKPEMENEFKKAADIVESDQTPNDPVAAARTNLSNRRPLPKEPDICLDLIEKALRKEPGIAVIMNSAHSVVPATGGGAAISQADRLNIDRIHNWSQSETIRANRNVVLLLTDQASKISNELRLGGNEIQITFIAKPEAGERKSFIRAYTEGTGEQGDILRRLKIFNSRLPRQKNSPDVQYLATQIERLQEQLKGFPELYLVAEDLDVNTFTVATQGLSLAQIRELMIKSKKSGSPLNLKLVNEKKHQILSSEYSDVMEVVNPAKGLEDIGGMEHLKKYFRSILDAIRKGDIRRVPMGITLMGPPGTGKTAFVEALAKEAGFHMVKKRNLRSKWVGESEDKNDKFINCARSLVPLVIMNDEADLGEANRDAPKGDSGVSERLMQAWMTFLSDPKIRGRVIVINCTNRPDRMDAALKRSGRSDQRILLPMPSTEEIPAIFEVMFKRYDIKTSIRDFSKYARLVDGRSGSDIEAITLSSLNFASKEGQDEDEIVVDGKALTRAINDSISSASQADIDYMTLVGLLESSSRELLPPNIHKLLTDIKRRNLIKDIDVMFNQIRERHIVDLDPMPEFAIK